MDTGIIPMRYAKALIAFAKEQKAEKPVYENMRLLSQSYTQQSDLRKIMDNPLVLSEDKLMLASTAAGGNVCEQFTRFVQLVLRQRRENFLQSMSLLYIELYRKSNHIQTVSLVTATPVTKTEEDKIRKLINKSDKDTLEFKVSVDKDILGGFILTIGTYRMDASVNTQLKRVKAQFIKKNSLV